MNAFRIFCLVVALACATSVVAGTDIQPSVQVRVQLDEASPIVVSRDDVALATLLDGKALAFLSKWDFGSDMDVQAAQLLAEYGFKGTFNFGTHRTVTHPATNIPILLDMGMGVGAYTTHSTHMSAVSYRRALYETVQSRRRLTELAGRPGRGFTYPGNQYQTHHRTAAENFALETVMAAGYLFDMHIGGRGVEIYDAGYHGNRTPFFHIASNWTVAHGNAETVAKAFEQARQLPIPVLCMASHFWEFWDFKANTFHAVEWPRLKKTLTRYARRPDIWYATHDELATYLYACRLVRRIDVESADSAALLTVTLDDPVPVHFVSPITVALDGRLPVQSVQVNGRPREFESRNGRHYFNLQPNDFVDPQLTVRVKPDVDTVRPPGSINLRVTVPQPKRTSLQLLLPDGWRGVQNPQGESHVGFPLAVTHDARLGLLPLIVKAIESRQAGTVINYGMIDVTVLPRVSAEMDPLYLQVAPTPDADASFILKLHNESDAAAQGIFRFQPPSGWRVEPNEVAFELTPDQRFDQKCQLRTTSDGPPTDSFILNGQLYLDPDRTTPARSASRGIKIDLKTLPPS